MRAQAGGGRGKPGDARAPAEARTRAPRLRSDPRFGVRGARAGGGRCTRPEQPRARFPLARGPDLVPGTRWRRGARVRAEEGWWSRNAGGGGAAGLGVMAAAAFVRRKRWLALRAH